MSEGTIWERLRWWLTWRIWRPLRRRCSFCGLMLVPMHDRRADGIEYDERAVRLGWGAWGCTGCTDYGEG